MALPHTQGQVEGGASRGIVDGGSYTLHEVVGDIKHYRFEEQSA